MWSNWRLKQGLLLSQSFRSIVNVRSIQKTDNECQTSPKAGSQPAPRGARHCRVALALSPCTRQWLPSTEQAWREVGITIYSSTAVKLCIFGLFQSLKPWTHANLHERSPVKWNIVCKVEANPMQSYCLQTVCLTHGLLLHKWARIWLGLQSHWPSGRCPCALTGLQEERC